LSGAGNIGKPSFRTDLLPTIIFTQPACANQCYLLFDPREYQKQHIVGFAVGVASADLSFATAS